MKKWSFTRGFDPEKKQPLSKKRVLAALSDIEKAYEARKRTSFHQEPFARTKAESAAYFLRREIYALGCHMIMREPEGYSPQDLIDSTRSRKTTRPDVEPSGFHALLMCMYDEDTDQSRRDRWEMAKELQYARLHRVPPELLAGFLLQSGPRKEIVRKLKAGYVEPGFREILAQEQDAIEEAHELDGDDDPEIVQDTDDTMAAVPVEITKD